MRRLLRSGVVAGVDPVELHALVFEILMEADRSSASARQGLLAAHPKFSTATLPALAPGGRLLAA